MLANDGGRFYEANKNYVTKVRVLLRDVNDNDPVFLNGPYSVDIMENQTDIVLVYEVSVYNTNVPILLTHLLRYLTCAKSFEDTIFWYEIFALERC